MVLSIGFKVEAMATNNLLGQFFWVNESNGYVAAFPKFKSLECRWVAGGCLRE